MTPRFTIHDHADTGDADIVFQGEILKRSPTCSKNTDIQGIGLVKFMHPVLGALLLLLPKYFIGVKAIFGLRAVFQIVEAIIGAVSIFMVDLFLIDGQRTFEGEQDKLMHQPSPFYGLDGERYPATPVGGNVPFHPSPTFGSSDSALIGCLIKPFVSRYVLPLFNWHGQLCGSFKLSLEGNC